MGGGDLERGGDGRGRSREREGDGRGRSSEGAFFENYRFKRGRSTQGRS